jgi:hypothetical protein
MVAGVSLLLSSALVVRDEGGGELPLPPPLNKLWKVHILEVDVAFLRCGGE